MISSFLYTLNKVTVLVGELAAENLDKVNKVPDAEQAGRQRVENARTDLADIVAVHNTVRAGAGAMYPSQWNDPPQFTGLTFPEEADGSVIVIYQADPACGVRFRQASNKIPRWPLS